MVNWIAHLVLKHRERWDSYVQEHHCGPIHLADAGGCSLGKTWLVFITAGDSSIQKIYPVVSAGWYFVFCRVKTFFMPLRSKIEGHIVFVLSVILSFCPSLWNFNLAHNFWTMSARALIFHMSIFCDKTFPWIPLFLTLWPWPWILTHFLKTLTLLIPFEQWVLELWYFTWVFLLIIPFCGYRYFWPCDLDLRVWCTF